MSFLWIIHWKLHWVLEPGERWVLCRTLLHSLRVIVGGLKWYWTWWNKSWHHSWLIITPGENLIVKSSSGNSSCSMAAPTQYLLLNVTKVAPCNVSWQPWNYVRPFIWKEKVKIRIKVWHRGLCNPKKSNCEQSQGCQGPVVPTDNGKQLSSSSRNNTFNPWLPHNQLQFHLCTQWPRETFGIFSLLRATLFPCSASNSIYVPSSWADSIIMLQPARKNRRKSQVQRERWDLGRCSTGKDPRDGREVWIKPCFLEPSPHPYSSLLPNFITTQDKDSHHSSFGKV